MELREVLAALESKISMAAKLTGRSELCVEDEPSLYAENRFLRAENEVLKIRLQETEDLKTLVTRQSEMLKMQSQALRRFENTH